MASGDQPPGFDEAEATASYNTTPPTQRDTQAEPPEDAVLAYWKEHREQLRQSENQRAVLTNYVLVIVAAISGFIVQQHFDLRTLPLSVLIMVIGLYGALAVAMKRCRLFPRT